MVAKFSYLHLMRIKVITAVLCATRIRSNSLFPEHIILVGGGTNWCNSDVMLGQVEWDLASGERLFVLRHFFIFASPNTQSMRAEPRRESRESPWCAVAAGHPGRACASATAAQTADLRRHNTMPEPQTFLNGQFSCIYIAQGYKFKWVYLWWRYRQKMDFYLPLVKLALLVIYLIDWCQFIEFQNRNILVNLLRNKLSLGRQYIFII